ncbi:MAG: hypothetical protein U0Z26_09675 [Anaerolineales bacterium]
MERSTRISIFIILFALAGVIVGLIGISYCSEGLAGFQSVYTDPDPELIRSWFPYFRTYMWGGALFGLGGLGYLVSAFFLWNAEERGRQIGLYAGGAIVLGWGIIKNLSLHFRNPPSFGSLLVGLLALYLFTEEFRRYCSVKAVVQ